MRARHSHLQSNKLITTAVVLLAAVAAFGLSWLVSQTVTAAPNTAYTKLSLADPFTPVRGAVSGGHVATTNSLTQSVDKTAASADTTEILAKSIPDSSAIKASLKIDPDWQGKAVRVGLWGDIFSSKDTESTPGWPIIEFTTLGANGFTGFRVYDTHGDTPSSLKWRNLTNVNFEWGKTYTLEIAYNASDATYRFYINDTEALKLDASRSDNDRTSPDVNDGSPRDTFRTIMFATYNPGTSDYSAHWTNAAYGIPKQEQNPPAPAVTTPLTTATTDKPITLTTPAGTTVTASSTQLMNKTQPDSAYTYPLGLVDFSFTTDKKDNVVTLVFVTNLKPNQVVARKYNPTSHTYTTIEGASISETTLKGKHALKLSYTIVDNGPLDLDPAVGAISDPVGLAQVPGTPNTGLVHENILPIVAASLGGIALVVLGVIALRRATR